MDFVEFQPAVTELLKNGVITKKLASEVLVPVASAKDTKICIVASDNKIPAAASIIASTIINKNPSDVLRVLCVNYTNSMLSEITTAPIIQ